MVMFLFRFTLSRCVIASHTVSVLHARMYNYIAIGHDFLMSAITWIEWCFFWFS